MLRMSQSHSQVQMDGLFVRGCGCETYIIWYDVIWPHIVVLKNADNFAYRYDPIDHFHQTHCRISQ